MSFPPSAPPRDAPRRVFGPARSPASPTTSCCAATTRAGAVQSEHAIAPGVAAPLLHAPRHRAILRTDTGHTRPRRRGGAHAGRGRGAARIVSIGGGSVIGLGKAVSLRLGPAARVPHIAVTTTYSGSEQNGTYGITEAGHQAGGARPTGLPCPGRSTTPT